MDIKTGSAPRPGPTDRHRAVGYASAAIVLVALGFFLGSATELPQRLRAFRDDALRMSARVRQEGVGAVAAEMAAAAAEPPRRLIIDVKQKDLQLLQYKRQEALRIGYLVTEEDSRVPAKVTADGKLHQARMRLKGDLLDHLQGKKWSYRIETRGGDAIWGMRRFSIQSPERSAFLREWFLHRWLREEGLIGLRYDFIEAVLNGEPLGVHALEESFAKELIEHNCRREGPILKLDESRLMDPRSVGWGDRHDDDDLYFAADVHSFDSGRTLEDPLLAAQFARGRALLEGVRSGTLPLAEAFDVARSARLYAMFDVLQGGHHALRWKNVRFYYDPTKDRLELIAYNAYGLHRKREPITTVFYQDWLAGDVGTEDVHAWHSVFFSDADFVDAYFRELRRITGPGYLEGVVARLLPEMAAAMALLRREYPDYGSPVPQYLAARDRVRQVLEPKLAVRAYLERTDAARGSVSVLVANNTFLPLTVERLGIGSSDVGPAVEPTVLPGKLPRVPVEHRIVDFPGLTPEEMAAFDEKKRDGDRLLVSAAALQFRFLGEPSPRSIPLDALALEPARELAPPAVTYGERLRTLERAGAVRYTPGERLVEFLPGVHRIDADIVLPAGFRIVGGPGTVLELVEGASIVSHAPVHFAGRRGAPFVIDSPDGRGQGLVVLQAGGPSELTHVVFTNQQAARKGLWELTGAMTFVESDVAIKDSRLSDTAAEDLINVIRGSLHMERTDVGRSRSDALDADFCTLTIADSRFTACGNDCLDVSGTKAEIRGVTIDGAGDKGISVGERSDATVRDVTIANATTGLASKDDSTVRIDKLAISTSGTGLAAYQKKPEFSGARIEAAGLTLDGVTRGYVRDGGSSIQVGGAEVAAEPFQGEAP